MSCLTAIVNWGANQLEQIIPRIEESCVVADQADWLASCGLSAPSEGEPNWHEWNVQALSADECRAFAAEAKSSARWEAFKAWMVIIGGTLASIVYYAVMLVVAAAILLLPMIAVVELCLPIAEYNAILGGICSFLGGFSIGGLIYMPLLSRLVAIAPRLWTKELLPAINRSFSYSAHFWDQANQLQAKADAPPAAAAEEA